MSAYTGTGTGTLAPAPPRQVGTHVVLLGAGRPRRGARPSALADAGPNGRVLDWLLEAVRSLDPARITFVGGYQLSEIVARYPDISFSLNRNWEFEGPLGSLLSAPLDAGATTYVSYTDVLYEPEGLQELADADGDVVLLADREWRTRFAGRAAADVRRAEKIRVEDDVVLEAGLELAVAESAELAGVVKLSPRAVEELLRLRTDTRTWARASLPAFVQHAIGAGLDVRAVFVEGRWAELDAPQDLARFVLSTKAKTLQRLRPLLSHSMILESLRFSLAEWADSRAAVLRTIAARFPSGKLIVRSSTTREDSWRASNAGAFDSVARVPAARPEAVADAIDRVVSSYGSGAEPHEEVLVQPFLEDVLAAGVMMTRNPRTGAPYVTINYDDSGSTDSITAGTAHAAKTVYVHASRLDAHGLGPLVDLMVRAARELVQLAGHDALDIEFAVLPSDVVAVLQVRPIVLRQEPDEQRERELQDVLVAAEHKWYDLQEPGPNVVGERTYLGVMPDWNPAEILGLRPRPLALSLYEHLVTDEVWATQRAQFGYRDVRPCPLVVTLAGQSFVDVRASFNSFVPAALGDDLAARIVEHYLERLREAPHLHDKVEFEIALTCVPFDVEEQLERRLGGVLSEAERGQVRAALAALTATGVGRLEGDLATVGALERRIERTLQSVGDPLVRAHLLLEDCRRIGTLAFAHLARQAFIATEWLRSLVRTGVIDEAQVEAFQRSLSTVSGQFARDAGEVGDGRLSADAFLERYGHLRPGTYEVTSPCYAEAFELPRRGAPLPTSRVDHHEPAFTGWGSRACVEIEAGLRLIGVPMSADAFTAFARDAIAGREYAKFAFTRALSAALEDFAALGAGHGLSREEVSFLRVGDFLIQRSESTPRWGERLKDAAAARRQEYERALGVELPELVLSAHDLWAFEQARAVANFVGTGAVTGRLVSVAAETMLADADLEGAIAMIPSADPGYDWLFLRGIAGLITAYGGTNSHMAIRAAELGVTAAIGVGGARYAQLEGTKVVELDCGARDIRVVW